MVFWGSGKTTLLRNLLVQSHEKNINVGVIVNDMSELDVDGELVAHTEVVEQKSTISFLFIIALLVVKEDLKN